MFTNVFRLKPLIAEISGSKYRENLKEARRAVNRLALVSFLLTIVLAVSLLASCSPAKRVGSPYSHVSIQLSSKFESHF